MASGRSRVAPAFRSSSAIASLMNAAPALVSDPAIEPPEGAPDEGFAAAERANREADRRRRAYWIVGLGTVGLLAALIAIGIFVERTSFYAPVAALNDRLAAEGAPMTWKAVQDAAPRPPAELDGTAEWEAFLKPHERFVEFDPLDPKTSEANAAGWIAELKELAASGRYRVARYPTSVLLEDDYMVVLNVLSAENNLARFLVPLAKKQHEKGDVDGAAESLALSLSLAANARYEPFLVCRLSGNAQLGYAMDGVEPLIAEANVSPERLAQLQRALERCDVTSNLDSMRLHELLIQRDYATNGQLTDYDINPIERWVARRVFVRQLELVDRVRRAQGLDPVARLAELEAVDEAFARQAEEEAPYTTAALATLVHHDFRSNNVLHELYFVENELRRRALIAAIACRRFEQDRESLPDDWADLVDYGVGQPPLNPWTGEPMTLGRSDEDGVTIEAPWIEEALAARQSRLSSESPPEPFDGITLSPRSP